MVAKIATGEVEEDIPSNKRNGGVVGGKARAAKLTAEQRSAIARRAAQARWRRNLTVCIAALCDNATKVVIAADRMLTGSDVEFEQDIRKFEPITSECVALSAGSALEKVDLIRSCRFEVSTAKSPTISDIVSSIKNCYVTLRVQRAEELHLKPIGLTLNDFLRVQGQLAPDVVLRQTHNIENESLGVLLLIAGVDSSGGHHLFGHGPRYFQLLRCSRILCHRVWRAPCRAGIHSLQFSRSLLRYEKHCSWLTEGSVMQKTAPGVGGQFTDLAYVDAQGLHVVSGDDVQLLAKAYQDLQKQHSSVND